ncbi:MAG TPA: glycosyltransferase [Actinomycetota bacterium]|nr:glycosyltransferase [Actinomycetota bacterium]
MRLLYVVHYPVFGGPHNQAMRMNRALAERGWDTTVVVPDEPGNARDRLRAGGVDVATVRLGRLRATPDPRAQARVAAAFPGDVARLRALMRARDASAVIVGGFVNPHAAVAARLEGLPVVWQVVDSRTPAPLRVALRPVVARLADALMFDGHALIPLHFGVRPPARPIVVYYPPVDTSRFAPSDDARSATRAELGIPAAAPVVGMVANVNPQKGIEHFVRAAALVSARRPECRFVLVGATYATHRRYAARVLAELDASPIPRGHFLLAGERADVERLYPAMDVKVVTSVPRSEGTTTTALEAMACGVPVVVPRVAAIPEVVDDGDTGVVVPPLDAGAVATAILSLLDDDDRRRAMARRARAVAVERFDVERCADDHVRALEAATARRRALRAGSLAAPAPRAPHAELRAALACPSCRGDLDWHDDRARCDRCSAAYPVVDGIPVLLAADGGSTADKVRQARYFDEAVDEEFEIARPHGAPRFYAWLMGEKFRRSVAGIEDVVDGGTAVTVCGGSAMDAELLARAGARVVVTDISLGAMRRAKARAERFGVPLLPVVADAERLPLRDRAVDVAYVHDGLHHLEAPFAGLAEMARVAGTAVSVTEPAKAGVTALAVRAGLAQEYEDAGNRIARLDPADVAAKLARAGVVPVRVERYAMYYRHEPGAIFRAASAPVAFPIATAAWRVANAALGRAGNKLAVVARRDRP